MSKALSYRSDVDGLRALAVLSVIIFHGNPHWLPGGFIGVDIFFVISGFLITGIIYKENIQGNFSILNFYDRRVKRILPLFFVVLVSTIIAAYFVLLPYDYLKFSVSSVSTLFFASNLNYAVRTGGYFDTDAEEWPLLHTWSLSVEEQFYFVWPILMLIVFYIFKGKSPTKSLLILLSLLFLGSILLAEVLMKSAAYSSWNYYLMPTRAAPMLLGAFIAIVLYNPRYAVSEFLSTGYVKHVISILGLCFIVASLLFIDRHTPFPGVSVIIPSLGAGLLILSPSSAVINRLLSIRWVVFLGLISYSLYLWHWPLFAFARYIMNIEAGSELPIVVICLIFLATFLLSVASWRFVETPCRKLGKGFWKNFIRVYLLPAIIILLIGVSAWTTNGNPSRFDSQGFVADKILFHIDKNICSGFTSLGCPGGERNTEHKVLLFGDSHAEHFFAFWNILGKKDNFSVDLVAAGGCTVSRVSKKCNTSKQYMFDVLDEYDVIVLSYNWVWSSADYSIGALQKLLDQLRTYNKKIVFMGQTPYWNVHVSKLWNCNRFFSGCLSDKLGLTIRDSAIKADKVIQAYSKDNGLTYLSLFDFSNTQKIQPYDSKGVQLYLDEGHLNISGAEQAANNYYQSEAYKQISAGLFK